MKNITKGLIAGIGIGAIAGVGTSLATLIIAERESIRVEQEFEDNVRQVSDYLKTDDGKKHRCLFKDVIDEISDIGEIRLSEAFRNLPRAVKVNKKIKEDLKGFLSDLD